MSNENIKLIKKFVNDFSLETTPNVYKKYGSFADLLDKNHLIYITYLPDENMGNLFIFIDFSYNKYNTNLYLCYSK